MAGSRPGRPVKPTALKRLEGVRPSRLNDAEPIPGLDEIAAPDWLSAPAQAVWDDLAPDLTAKGVLTPWDVPAFAALCNVIVVNRDALADLAEHSATVTAVARELKDGTITYRLTRNPSWAVARESSVVIANLGGRFGLNPSDRAQLHVEPYTVRKQGRPGGDGSDLLNPARLLT